MSLSARNEEKTDRSAHHLSKTVCHYLYLRIRNKKTDRSAHHLAEALPKASLPAILVYSGDRLGQHLARLLHMFLKIKVKTKIVVAVPRRLSTWSPSFSLQETTYMPFIGIVTLSI